MFQIRYPKIAYCLTEGFLTGAAAGTAFGLAYQGTDQMPDPTIAVPIILVNAFGLMTQENIPESIASGIGYTAGLVGFSVAFFTQQSSSSNEICPIEQNTCPLPSPFE
jgi:hypothetical protein